MGFRGRPYCGKTFRSRTVSPHKSPDKTSNNSLVECRLNYTRVYMYFISDDEFLIDLHYDLMPKVKFKSVVDYATFWTSIMQIPEYIDGDASFVPLWKWILSVDFHQFKKRNSSKAINLLMRGYCSLSTIWLPSGQHSEAGSMSFKLFRFFNWWKSVKRIIFH